MEPVVITGMGCVAGNGRGKEALQAACSAGVSGIKPCTAFPTQGLRTSYFGQCDLPEGDRLQQLIQLSVAEMLEDSGVTPQQLAAEGNRCRLFFGTLLATTDSYYRHSLAKQAGQEPDGTLAEMHDYLSYTKSLLGVRGPAMVCSAACASGTTAAGMALEYIRSGLCDVAVMGGADPLTLIAGYGFHSLKSLSAGVCNPYDENRDGINIGECGAFFLVESLSHARARGARIYCELLGYGLGNDGYHATSPDPTGQGAYRTMEAALEDGGVSPAQVDAVNGHGTGTVLNDSMEVQAIRQLFQPTGRIPAVSSTKALLGHCMGSSGAIELASVILSMVSGTYLPLPHLEHPMAQEDEMFLSSQPGPLDIKIALSNSFAFAGNSASLLVRRWEEKES